MQLLVHDIAAGLLTWVALGDSASCRRGEARAEGPLGGKRELELHSPRLAQDLVVAMSVGAQAREQSRDL